MVGDNSLFFYLFAIKHIRFVNAFLFLHSREKSLKTHAGIYTHHLQFFQFDLAFVQFLPRTLAKIFIENDIPDFHILPLPPFFFYIFFFVPQTPTPPPTPPPPPPPPKNPPPPPGPHPPPPHPPPIYKKKKKIKKKGGEGQDVE